VPGPGVYEGSKISKKAPICIIGKASREDLRRKEKEYSPGPGDYKVPTAFGNRDVTDPKYKFV